MNWNQNTIVGDVYPNHLIGITRKMDLEVMELLSENSPVEHAKEMKAAVILIQNPDVGCCPDFLTGGRPQRIISLTAFNNRATTTCLKVWNSWEIFLLSVYRLMELYVMPVLFTKN